MTKTRPRRKWTPISLYNTIEQYKRIEGNHNRVVGKDKIPMNESKCIKIQKSKRNKDNNKKQRDQVRFQVTK